MVTGISEEPGNWHFRRAWCFMLNKAICLLFLIGTTTRHERNYQDKAQGGAGVDAMIAQDFNLQGKVTK